MSYCRWSSNDFQCDVYVYADVHGGFSTHVAGSRYVFTEPLPEPVQFSTENLDAWIARDQKVSDMLDYDTMEPIGLPHDGESFNHDTATECAQWLTELKGMGYVVPQSAIDALIEEGVESGEL